MQELVQKLSALLTEKKMMLVTAESCTGGLLASTITAEAGTSAFFERGYVTYSNESKTDLLGVKKATLSKHGAVSAETAAEMANGALFNSKADIAISITGIAGPDGGTDEKPVGLVYFGHALKNGTNGVKCLELDGGRTEIQVKAVSEALIQLILLAEEA